MVEVGDLDGDGQADLILYNPNTGTAYIATKWSNATYNFQSYVYNLWSAGFTRICAGDFNGDGVSDVLLYRRSDGIAYLGINTTPVHGTFSSTSLSFSGQFFSPGYDFLQAGDLNGDGKTDLIVYNSSTGTAWVLLSTGGGFPNGIVLGLSPGYTQLQVADVTGDGIADVLVYNKMTGAMYLGIGNGDGTFAFTYTGWGPGYDFVERRDLNGDGKMDFILYNATTGQEYSAISLGGSQGFSYVPNLWSSPGFILAPWTGEWNVSGGGKSIIVLSTKNVSDATRSVQNYRWEPSSAAGDSSGSTWITSWHDVGIPRGQPDWTVTHAYTSVWHGSWSAPFEQTKPNGGPIMDSFTYWDGRAGKFALVGIEYPSPYSSALFRYSTDSSGTSWSSMRTAIAADSGPAQVTWDFASVAVDQNTGRVVVGASKNVPAGNAGYWTSWSTDGGGTWYGPYNVNGPTGGGTSRMVWSASGFHAFIQATVLNIPMCTTLMDTTLVLQHWQSSDGQTWARQGDISTYCAPNLSSLYDLTHPPYGYPAGELSFAATPDAVSSPGLGWVVAYPVNISGYNGINVNSEFGCGTTVNSDPSNPVNLMNAGIATSARGDWYLTFGVAGNPLVDQWAGYRPPGDACQPSFKYLSQRIQHNIDPTQSWYYNNGAGRCHDSQICYTSGDYFRPAMDVFTDATVPVVMGSANLTDLFHAFIYDPPVPSIPQLIFEPRRNGDNITSRGVMTQSILQHAAEGHYRFRVSSMLWDALYRAGRLPKSP